ncbi:hypothetical protein Tco_1448140, partial [Tanacetum coccineum]
MLFQKLTSRTNLSSLETISAIEDALGMERDCQHGLYKAGMGSSRVLSDFAEKYGSKNRVLAGFGIGGKSGKEKVYKLGCDRGRLKMIK